MRDSAKSTLGWAFGISLTILFISLWGRAVVVDTDTLGESLAPLSGSAMVVEYVADWMGQELVESGVDPDLVDWSAYGVGREFPFRLIQDAGRRNALGSIKFMFPNPYGVYLHDTSTPSLFRKDDRFFSSGCIRVEKPLELASSVLSRQEPTPPEKVGAMIAAAPANRHLTLERTMPLYVVYMTAWADEENAYFYNDFYKRDSKLLNSIN